MANGYPDPLKVAEQTERWAHKKNFLPSEARVIDFGCGTGLIGQELVKKGFYFIDGVDCSKNMLRLCKEKKAYKMLNEATLGLDDWMDSLPHLMRARYDFAVGADFVNTHFQSEFLFDNLLFSLKPMGICILACQYSFMGNFWYFNVMEELVENKRIKILDNGDNSIFYRYTKLAKGVGKYNKTPAKVIVFQKIEADSMLTSNKKKRSSMAISDVSY